MLIANLVVQNIIFTPPKFKNDFVINRERLRTSALEMFAAVEKAFAEFQEEMYNSKEKSARLKRLLDIVTPPEIKIHQIGR